MGNIYNYKKLYQVKTDPVVTSNSHHHHAPKSAPPSHFLHFHNTDYTIANKLLYSLVQSLKIISGEAIFMSYFSDIPSISHPSYLIPIEK